MKKFGLIVAAFAVMLGLSQCNKKHDMPVFWENSTKTITLTTSCGGNAKGDFDDEDGKLKYAWNMNHAETVLVYIQGGGESFTEGKYIGTMNLVSVSDTYSATFQGEIKTLFPSKGWIRFVHCGRNIALTPDGNATYDVDFSTQYGVMETISKNVIAVCDQRITEDCTFNFSGCNLDTQFGVVKFTFNVFEGIDDVVLHGITHTGLRVNANGVIEYLGGTTSTLKGMDDNMESYCAVLMPKDETTYLFTKGYKIAYKKTGIEAGSFYTEGGDPLTLKMLNAVPGDISVSNNKKVRFATGNLQYLPCGLPKGDTYTDYFRFAENQWDVLGDSRDYGVDLPGYTLYNDCTSNRESARDLFGWGTACFEGNPVPWQCNAINPHFYGPIEGNLNDGTAAGKNYEKYDWGRLMNPNNMWRTMSMDEFSFVMEDRDNNETFNSVGKCLSGYGYLNYGGKARYGLFILPDNYYDTESNPVYTEKTGWNITDTQLNDFRAVFMPAGGYRNDDPKITGVEVSGRYWTSTRIDYENANNIAFDKNNTADYDTFFMRFIASHVRLVIDL